MTLEDKNRIVILRMESIILIFTNLIARIFNLRLKQ